MIRLSKSQLPPHVTIKSAQNCREGEVFAILKADCYEKCYICEDKPTVPNVEHRVPHRGDPALKLSWDNLLLSCGHCNNIKLDKYDDILDPVKCDPEEHIALSVEISGDLKEQVKVEALTTDSSTRQTAELLGFVYNGGVNDEKDLGSSHLRNTRLLPDIRRFYQYIYNYRREPELNYAEIISKEIGPASAFAAFKRKIVRDDPELSGVFAEALNIC
jgi:hypothetical protein